MRVRASGLSSRSRKSSVLLVVAVLERVVKKYAAAGARDDEHRQEQSGFYVHSKDPKSIFKLRAGCHAFADPSQRRSPRTITAKAWCHAGAACFRGVSSRLPIRGEGSAKAWHPPRLVSKPLSPVLGGEGLG